ncbi:U2 snrnp-specific A [Cryptosporidium sp. chipmunk genotype I]|uniref:U2 snrnp-specific A n=1 Tax=Cryptosporidium sp. chipmunk genotype I TaxID=1280935 RepID=UPI003519DC91|nr:U2 snrnp-specific A [Cryptosporidium sp. chipmunk genotype I]
MEASIRNRLRKQDLVLPDEEVPNTQDSNINSIDYSEVKELVLDGVKLRELTQQDSEFLGRFSELQYLSLNATGLQRLDNFPLLENLKVLEIQDNHISGGLDILRNYKNLRCLLLGGNKIRDFSELIVLKELPKLETLSLLLNPIAEKNSESYRSIVFETLPNLQILDEMNKEGKEVEDYGYDDEEVEIIDDDTEGGDEEETSIHAASHGLPDDDEDEFDDEDDEDVGQVDLKQFYENDLEDDDDEDDFEPGDVDLDGAEDFEDEDEDEEEEDDDEIQASSSKKQRIEQDDDEDEDNE